MKNEFELIEYAEMLVRLFLWVFGIGTVLGYIFGFSLMKSMNPSFEDIRLITALMICCMLSIMAYPKWEMLWAGGILIICVYHLIFIINNVEYPNEPIFQPPGTGTIFSFLSIFFALSINQCRKFFASITVWIGAVAAFGYAMNMPALYFNFSIFHPMPFHICVILPILGLWLFKKKPQKNNFIDNLIH